MSPPPPEPVWDAAPNVRRQARDGRATPYDAAALTDVAVRVFFERGYEGTSMRDLARAAHITQSSFYNHVRSKEELLDRAITHVLDALSVVLQEPGAVNGSAVDRLDHVLRRLVTVLGEHVPYVALLVRLRGNTRTERRLITRRDELIRRLERFLAAVDQERARRVGPHLAIRTRLLFGLVTSVADWYAPRDGCSASELSDAVAGFVLNAWASSGGPVTVATTALVGEMSASRVAG